MNSTPSTTPPTPVPGFPDIFSSTGPFAGPPETWQELAASYYGKRRALALGPLHGELVRSLLDLGRDNGGGLTGLARGMLSRLNDQQLITANQRRRGGTPEEDGGRGRPLPLHLREACPVLASPDRTRLGLFGPARRGRAVGERVLNDERPREAGARRLFLAVTW